MQIVRRSLDTLDVTGIVMRQFTRAPERPGHLQEAEAHQIRAERHAQKDDPARQFHVGRDLFGGVESDHKHGAHRSHDEGEQRPAKQPEQDNLFANFGAELIDDHINADMNAGTYAVGGAEFGHPHEHVDAQFLRPSYIDVIKIWIEKRYAYRVALQHRDENQKSRG